MHKICCPIKQTALKYPNQIALIEDQQTLTYQRLDHLIDQAVDNLQKEGINPNSRVAILSQNSINYVIALWALWRLNVVSVHLNIRNPKQTILKQLQNLNCRNLLSTNLKESWPQINHIHLDNLTHLKNYQPKPQEYCFDLNQELTILYTSGTSAEPKAALHTFGNHYFSAFGSNKHIPINKSSRWLLSLPLYHVGGLSILFRMFLSQEAAVLTVNKNRIVHDIVKHKITHISLVPTQLIRLLENQKNIYALQKLKCILIGGSSILGDLLNQCKKNKLPIYVSYGLTEMSSQVATSQKQNTNKTKILKFRKLKIGQNKEILVKGKTLFKGYILKNKLHPSVDKAGWFHTGDLGQWTKEKSLQIIGRKDNMFISGGENIQPEEIEKCILKNPEVLETVIVAKPDQEFGFRPIAFIKFKSHKKIDPTQLTKNLSKQLPKFKIPTKFIPWPKSFKTHLKPSRSKFQKLIND